jgi:hypothetical protein
VLINTLAASWSPHKETAPPFQKIEKKRENTEKKQWPPVL